MRYLPVNLDIAGRKAVVVGGGSVALRKARALAACGAAVTVVSPEISAGFRRIPGIRFERRRYRGACLRGAVLVVGATDSEEVNRSIWRDATKLGMPVNIVDRPEICTFTFPASIVRGSMVITISTGGASPALSKRIRKLIEKEIGGVLSRQLDLLAEIRPAVRASGLGLRKRMALNTTLAGEKMGRLIGSKGVAAGRRAMKAALSDALAAAGRR